MPNKLMRKHIVAYLRGKEPLSTREIYDYLLYKRVSYRFTIGSTSQVLRCHPAIMRVKLGKGSDTTLWSLKP